MSDRTTMGLLVLSLALPGAARGEIDRAPVTLRRAVELALARAPEVAVARADADLAGASVRLARAQSGPEAFVGTSPGYTTGLPVLVAGQVPSLFNVAIRQPVYDVALRAGASMARAGLEERQSAFDRASVETARATVLAFARVAADEALVAGARRSLEAQEDVSRRAAALASEGRITALDADAAGLEVTRARQRLLDRSLAKELDELELKSLLDWPAAETLTIAGDPLSEVPAPPPSGNIEAARARDRESRGLEREIEALGAAARAHAQFLQPNVVAEAQYLRLARYNHYDDYFRRFKENDFSVALSISVPVWGNGRGREMAAEARARVERAEAALRVRGRDLELAVRRAEAELARAGAREGVARSAEAIARERVRVASALVAEGRGEPDAAPRADLGLAQAQDDLANAVGGLVAARVTLLVLRGELPGMAAGANP